MFTASENLEKSITVNLRLCFSILGFPSFRANLNFDPYFTCLAVTVRTPEWKPLRISGVCVRLVCEKQMKRASVRTGAG